MPIALSSVYEVPETGGTVTFPKAIINRIVIFVDYPRIEYVVQYGDVVEGSWIKGTGSVDLPAELMDQEYTDVLTQPTLDGETVYDAIKRLSYVELQAKYPQLAGSVT